MQSTTYGVRQGSPRPRRARRFAPTAPRTHKSCHAPGYGSSRGKDTDRRQPGERAGPGKVHTALSPWTRRECPNVPARTSVASWGSPQPRGPGSLSGSRHMDLVGCPCGRPPSPAPREAELIPCGPEPRGNKGPGLSRSQQPRTGLTLTDPYWGPIVRQACLLTGCRGLPARP